MYICIYVYTHITSGIIDLEWLGLPSRPRHLDDQDHRTKTKDLTCMLSIVISTIIIISSTTTTTTTTTSGIIIVNVIVNMFIMMFMFMCIISIFIIVSTRSSSSSSSSSSSIWLKTKEVARANLEKQKGMKNMDEFKALHKIEQNKDTNVKQQL